MVFICLKLNPIHSRMICAKSGWNWPSGSNEFINVFPLLHYYLPLEKGVALHLNKLESPSPKYALCQVWLTLAQWFTRFFLDFFIVFSLFRYYLLWKRGWPFIWTNLNSLYPRMLFAKFGWNWTSGSGENENVKSLQRDGQTGDQKRSIELSWAKKKKWEWKLLCDPKIISFNFVLMRIGKVVQTWC